MKKLSRSWAVLGTALSASTIAYSPNAGAVVKADLVDPPTHGEKSDPAGQPKFVLTASDGEGEGGSEAEFTGADYVAAFGLIEGHLIAGTELYAAGATDMAKTHMKHPGDEIYTDLLPEIRKRGKAGIAEEISAIAAVVESGGPAADAKAALETLKTAIDLNAAPANDRERANAIVKLVRTAAEEYAIGVKDGKITDMHEYQDAYGFVEAAKRLANGLPDTAKADVRAHLDGLQPLWPDIADMSAMGGDPSNLFGAAAHIELIALEL